MPNDNSLDSLHRLIRVNKEAEAGLHAAAKAVKNSELESLFTDYAKQHAKFGSELAEELQRRGGTLSASETEVHRQGEAPRRGWLASLATDIKSAVTGDSATALLRSCESGEESAEIAYHDAADANPSGQTHTLINKQWQQIKGFRTHLARLVGETKNGVDFQRNE